ncbi:unnamed protein product [Pleuronectes platessa]|uniref:Uncharacterized protein n=1 Tax=Pleuronectes platessa TaxID=8262 RepID=A0A9N7V3T0_PLEPL|nr:unnamed protein product [Pleuronectes platessa]
MIYRRRGLSIHASSDSAGPVLSVRGGERPCSQEIDSPEWLFFDLRINQGGDSDGRVEGNCHTDISAEHIREWMWGSPINTLPNDPSRPDRLCVPPARRGPTIGGVYQSEPLTALHAQSSFTGKINRRIFPVAYGSDSADRIIHRRHFSWRSKPSETVLSPKLDSEHRA